MKIFSVDTLPLCDDMLIANDYNSKYLYSAISDPLFRYCDRTKKIEPYACESFKSSNNFHKFVFELRDDLYFFNGEKATAEDYYNSFQKIIDSNCYTKYILEEVKKIKYINNSLIFYLKHRNKNFYKKLSMFNFTCVKNSLTSGPYYISNKGAESIELKRNSFFRTKLNNKHNSTIVFKVTNGIDDIERFEMGNLNITNNTIFPCDKINNYKNLMIKENYIYMNINFNNKFFSKSCRNFRRHLMNLINRDEINDELNGVYKNNTSFMIFNDSKTRNIKRGERYSKSYKPKKITLGYDNFYPNYIVASVLKKQVQRDNIKVQLIKNKFEFKNKSDINLVLNYPDYLDDESVLISNYFKAINAGFKYKIYTVCFRIFNSKRYLDKIDYYLLKNAVKIPILKMKSIYLCDKDLEKFNHVEFNFEEL